MFAVSVTARENGEKRESRENPRTFEKRRTLRSPRLQYSRTTQVSTSASGCWFSSSSSRWHRASTCAQSHLPSLQTRVNTSALKQIKCITMDPWLVLLWRQRQAFFGAKFKSWKVLQLWAKSTPTNT